MNHASGKPEVSWQLEVSSHVEVCSQLKQNWGSHQKMFAEQLFFFIKSTKNNGATPVKELD